jgi:hypothetical protein
MANIMAQLFEDCKGKINFRLSLLICLRLGLLRYQGLKHHKFHYQAERHKLLCKYARQYRVGVEFGELRVLELAVLLRVV